MENTTKKGSLFLYIDTPEYDYEYQETNSHENEMSDFYNYTDQEEFQINYEVLKKELDNCGVPNWKEAGEKEKHLVFSNLMDKFEQKSVDKRVEASRGILYLLQGCWKEARTVAEQQQMARENTMTFYQMEGFCAIKFLLDAKINQITNGEISDDFKECQDFSVIIAVLYSLVEIMRNEMSDLNNSPYKTDVINFRKKLSILAPAKIYFIPKCFNLMNLFLWKCPYIPIKKTLMLLWKLLIVALGNSEDRENFKKHNFHLVDIVPDKGTIEVTKDMHQEALSLYDEQLMTTKEIVYGSIDPATNWWKPKIYYEDLSDYRDFLRKRFPPREVETMDELNYVRKKVVTPYIQYLREVYEESSFHLIAIRIGEPSQILYGGLKRNLGSYMTSLVKIFIGATPPKISKGAPDLRDVISKRDKNLADLELRRTQEIVMKSITGILLIMLKFFNINHLHQFETVIAYLYKRKFLNVAIRHFRLNPRYVKEIHDDYSKIFPYCVLENLEIPERKNTISQRNMLSFINLLRVINKIVKGKPLRVLDMLSQNSSEILKPLLEVAHATPRVYILKLYKLMSVYYTRESRLQYIHILTAVRRCVRRTIPPYNQIIINPRIASRYVFDEETIIREITHFNNETL